MAMLWTVANRDRSHRLLPEKVPPDAQMIRESKGRSIIAFPDTYCVIDVETAGRSPQGDHVIEVAADKILEGQEVGCFNSLI